MIQMLPEPLDGEDVASGLPVVILGVAVAGEGVYAITVGDAGEARLIPWSEPKLRIPWRYDARANRWEDDGVLTGMAKEAKEDTEEAG